MRRLSEIELEQVKKAIVSKELTSAEILAEVYDHYLSHLESFEEADFESKLIELEMKFTQHYCKSLQDNHFFVSNRAFRKLQWGIFKSQFSWPKFLITAITVGIITFLWNKIDGRTRILALLVPLGISFLLVSWISIKSSIKVRRIKKQLGSYSFIQSDYMKLILVQWSIILSTLSLGVLFPKNIGWTDPFTNPFYSYITFFLALAYLGFLLTLIKAWKVKSKTAFI